MTGTGITRDRIGTSSPTFSLMDFSEVYPKIQAEFDIWEIVMEGQHHPDIIGPAIDDLLASHPMRLQVHVPISDINIGSVSEKLRKASVEEVLSAIRFAADHDASPVTVHPGHFSPVARECLSLLTDSMTRSLNELDKAAREWGVTVCLENMPNFPFTYCKETDELLEAIEGTDFLLTFDIGHGMTNENLDAFLIPEIVERLGNVHIHDNHGDSDSHLTLGDGSIDLLNVVDSLENAGYRGNYIIESRDLASSIESRKFLTCL